MFRLRIESEGLHVVDRVLEGVEFRAQDMTAAWPAVILEFRRIVRAAFASEGASTPAPWPQLKPATQRDRALKGFGPAHPILKRTGELERSLTGGGAGFVTPTPRALSIGSNDPVFPFHQSTRPRTQLPRRAPVNLTEDDKQALVHPMRLHLAGQDPFILRRAGTR